MKLKRKFPYINYLSIPFVVRFLLRVYHRIDQFAFFYSYYILHLNPVYFLIMKKERNKNEKNEELQEESLQHLRKSLSYIGKRETLD